MPKKKESTAAPVTKDPKKTANVEKPAAASPALKPAAAKPAEKPATDLGAKTVKATAKASDKPAAATPKAEKKPAAAKTTKAAGPSVTVVVAKYDVGHGNSLFIRGEGGGLRWEKGTQMENAGNDVWVWTTNAVPEKKVSFKFLINDESWCAGENMTAAAGETTTLYPAF
ncbi:MAG TPA: hypothetical protein PK880_03630 [Candidatus Competibacter sp.]|nr:hypothetical protein [Candidatus Competibacter sp.]